MHKEFGDGWHEFAKRQGFVLSLRLLFFNREIYYRFALSVILQTALERIRQDFLSDTQEAINNIETRSSMENISKSNKKDQHGKLGACV